ncbi:Transmembrane nucleoporin [Knufia obscura]|uniref:Transmembrane nucleoporin n=2 Tax=Knufia TaxID=430999 RepID=A0AAN8EY67_9EURO|nr:Transmembrane nucleoporin [Knufia obscura]KAK5956371.1 Transmembrane nucleoporin [Knufia fluminis]
MAAFSYRTAFVAAVATYGIVVYKAFRARVKPGSPPAQTAMTLLGDENVQYLLISLVWLISRQIPLALLPFSVYSVFHVATYTRTNILPTFQQQKPAASGQSPQQPKPQSGVGAMIGRFVKEYYDSSMMLVAALEIALWGRLFLSALTFSKGAWMLLGLYTVFLRARFHQSTFVQGAFSQFSARIDQQVNQQNIPPAAKNAWDTIKNLSRQAVDATDVRKYLGGAQTAPKKAQ